MSRAASDPQPPGRRRGIVARCRRWLRPLHPNRLRAAAQHRVHRLGWFHLRPWLGGLAPRRLASSLRWLLAAERRRRRRRSEPRLTVAVDISPLWQPLTGIGWYLHRLLDALADRDDVRLRLYGPALVDAGDAPPPVRPLPRGRALEPVTYRVPETFSIPRPAFAASLRRRSRWLVAADRNRVLFAPNYLLPEDFRGLAGAEVPVVHDLSAFRVPETMRETTLEQLRRDLAVTLRRARRVLTDSETVRQEMIDADLAAGDRIDVAPLAPALLLPSSFDSSSDLPPLASAGEGGRGGEGREVGGPYVLFVGTLEPRKNLPTLIDAFERYRRESGPGAAELVVCGGVGWKASALLERIEKAAEEGWLRYEGYVPDDRLVSLYRGAEWLALPSLYEGFGLPAVEAMAAGVPLLLSDIPVLREVAGEAALYAPPRDVDAWTARLVRALSPDGPRRELAAAARRRAARFSWAATADATVRCWRRAAASSVGRQRRR